MIRDLLHIVFTKGAWRIWMLFLMLYFAVIMFVTR